MIENPFIKTDFINNEWMTTHQRLMRQLTKFTVEDIPPMVLNITQYMCAIRNEGTLAKLIDVSQKSPDEIEDQKEAAARFIQQYQAISEQLFQRSQALMDLSERLIACQQELTNASNAIREYQDRLEAQKKV